MHYNDITGEPLVTKQTTDKYRTGWDAIFGKKDKVETTATEPVDTTKDSSNTPK